MSLNVRTPEAAMYYTGFETMAGAASSALLLGSAPVGAIYGLAKAITHIALAHGFDTSFGPPPGLCLIGRIMFYVLPILAGVVAMGLAGAALAPVSALGFALVEQGLVYVAVIAIVQCMTGKMGAVSLSK